MKDQWQIVTSPEATCAMRAVLNGHEFLISSAGFEYGIDSIENEGCMTRFPSGTCVLKIGIPLFNDQVKFIKETGKQKMTDKEITQKALYALKKLVDVSSWAAHPEETNEAIAAIALLYEALDAQEKATGEQK